MSFKEKFNNLMADIGDGIDKVGEVVTLVGAGTALVGLSAIWTGLAGGLTGAGAAAGMAVANTVANGDPATIAGGVVGGALASAILMATTKYGSSFNDGSEFGDRVSTIAPLLVGTAATALAITSQVAPQLLTAVMPGLRI